MIYSRLTNEELERWVYATPYDLQAQAEMMRRASGLINEQNDELVEVQGELKDATVQHARDIEELEKEIADADETIGDLSTELANANDRLAELTFAEDLV